LVQELHHAEGTTRREDALPNQLLREILTSRVYKVARETPLEPGAVGSYS
jgi:hypothetical protein